MELFWSVVIFLLTRQIEMELIPVVNQIELFWKKKTSAIL